MCTLLDCIAPGHYWAECTLLVLAVCGFGHSLRSESTESGVDAMCWNGVLGSAFLKLGDRGGKSVRSKNQVLLRGFLWRHCVCESHTQMRMTGQEARAACSFSCRHTFCEAGTRQEEELRVACFFVVSFSCSLSVKLEFERMRRVQQSCAAFLYFFSGALVLDPRR